MEFSHRAYRRIILRAKAKSRIPLPQSCMDGLKAVPFKESSSSRIQNAMQVEGRRPHTCLTEHHMHLAAMMRLMIEEMEYSVWCGICTVLTQAIGITE